MALLCHEGFDHEADPYRPIGSHAYWRLYSIVEAGSENYISIANLEFRAVAGVAQQATGGTPISSGDYSSGYVKAYAFDADNTTTWISSNILPNWIGYHFASAVACVEVAITNRYDGYFYQAPSSFEVQYSDDGTNWFTVLSQSGITWSTSAQTTQTFAVPTSVYYDDMSRHVGAVTWVSGTNVFVTGRHGLGKALTTNAGVVMATLASRLSSQFCGFRWCLNGTCTLTIGDSVAGAAQAVLTFGVTNHDVSLAIAGTTVWTSAYGVWASGNWYFVEIWPIIANSGGSFKILIDEGRTLSHTYSGDTQATANAVWDTITWDGTASGGTSPIDDFYACDTTTGTSGWSACNVPIGDCCTLTSFVTGTNAVSWTPGVPSGDDLFPLSTTNANWQSVCETAMDGNWTFNTTATVGAEDTFNFGTMPGFMNAVLAASVVVAERRNGNATASLASAFEMSGTEVYGAAYIPTNADFVYHHDTWFADPSDSSVLTLDKLNSVKAGYKLVSRGS